MSKGGGGRLPSKSAPVADAGYQFVSPNTTSLTFDGALKDLGSHRQDLLRSASVSIDKTLGVQSTGHDIIGAWEDGAENSVMNVIEHSDWNTLVLGGAMKGWLADQKQVLIFQQKDHGDAGLAKFEAKGDLKQIHQNLLQDGLVFHTLVPNAGGATVYVAVLANEHANATIEAIERGASRYDSDVEYQSGHAEFLGTDKTDGTDREQRDSARSAYEKIIEQSSVQGSSKIWAGVRDRWGSTLDQVEKATVATDLFNAKYDPSVTSKDIFAAVPGSEKKVSEVEQRLSSIVPTVSSTDVGGYTKDGVYTPEREKLHESIIRDVLNADAVMAAMPAPGERPTLTILGGRGGAGKSWFLSNGTDARHAIYLNPDDIQEKLPGYEGWNAAAYHDEAKDIVAELDKYARVLGVNVVHDATMKTSEGPLKRIAEYKADGYRIVGNYMFTPPQTSAKRAIERFMKSGRFVPVGYLLASRTNEKTFDGLKHHLDAWTLYDNSGSAPKLVANG